MEALTDPRVVGVLGLMVLLTVSPGPDMALVMGTALRGGRGPAIRTAIGICSGVVVWAALAGIGVAALLAASAEAFNVLRLAGAAYLVYLGVRAIRAAMRADDAGVAAGALPGGPGASRFEWRSSFRRGLTSNMLNPKVGVFYTTLVPQVVDPGDPVAFVSLVLGVVHALMGIAWLAFLAAAVDRAGAVLRRPRVRRSLEATSGAVLIAFGLRVAAERR
jgi:threonine/homoserine/homoserine lactone efflux protein